MTIEKILKYVGRYEAETILENAGEKITKEKLNYINAIKTLKQAKQIDDWFAFEKIIFGLNKKEVDFNSKQDPSLIDLFFALLISKKMVQLGKEIFSYAASVCIKTNLFVTPVAFPKVQKEINKYLLRNNSELIGKVPEILSKPKEEFEEDSLEYIQLEKLEEIVSGLNKKIKEIQNKEE